MNYTQNDIGEIKQRIINGNQILNDLRNKAFKTYNQNEYLRLMGIYDKKQPLLDDLCQIAMDLGFKECLYADNRPCLKDDENGLWICVVCPKG